MTKKNTLDLSAYYVWGLSILKVMFIVGSLAMVATVVYQYFF